MTVQKENLTNSGTDKDIDEFIDELQIKMALHLINDLSQGKNDLQLVKATQLSGLTLFTGLI